MNWFQLTTAEVLAQFNDSETSAYDAAKGDSAGADLPDLITRVADQIRQAYRDGGRALEENVPDSIPPGEVNRAVAMIRWKYLLALPTGNSLQTGERKQASEAAEAYFLKVAQRQIQHAGAVGLARPGQRVPDFNLLGSTGGGREW